MNEFPDIFTIVDTETTGMRPPFSRIIDIGIIRVEYGKEVERFQTLLNPGVSLPSFIERLTGITDEELARAPQFEEVALKVEELFADSVFVAHNAPFDYSFVQSEFARLGMSFSKETLCSVRLSRSLSPKSRSHNLDSVIERYGIHLAGDRHRALPDADAVWEFFKHVPQVHSSTDIERAVARARSGSGAPAIAKDSFVDLPDSAGVYFFYGPDQELLYIGKSKHVRTRARSHFHSSTSKKEIRLQGETNTISSIKTSGELSALLLESALIKSQSPLYNRALRKRKLLVIATEHTTDAGYTAISLERTTDITPTNDVLSVFRTVTQGKTVLRALAKEHQLCHKLLGVEAGSGACFGYQLGTCLGACAGKETPEAYNARVAESFRLRKLRAWPYKGTVMIDERGTEESRTVLFIRDWVLVGAYTYEGDSFEPLFRDVEQEKGFDYDTYKILVRYLLSPKNRRSLHVLTDRELHHTMERITGSADEEMLYVEQSIE
jgi:DNA polymerase III subunit epsilon